LKFCEINEKEIVIKNIPAPVHAPALAPDLAVIFVSSCSCFLNTVDFVPFYQ
jgi:hypothetical protein